MRSLVITFAADELAAGRITAISPDCAVRLYIADEVLEDGLDMMYEILGGTPQDRRAIIEESRRLFRAEFKPTQDRPEAWRATACFRDLEALHAHPVYGLLLEARHDADRLLLIYQAGSCVMRIDFPDGPGQWEERCRRSLRASGRDALVRVVPDLGRSLEDWQPLA